ncbi:TraB/GumN family protein [Aliidiomarina maris]|uniref:TraB/GumN family protein n=2 Tax=Aliidiomarina maris TaxID=531312 RepID=A0ABY0BTS1_9GAMM|nr:TraB/GumN family protein [Aliidiomarina maris]
MKMTGKTLKTFVNTCATAALLVAGSAQASLLWKVSGNDLEQPSYLFGTVHMICQSDFYMDERIEQAFANTQSLMLELDMSSESEMMRLQQLMVNPSGPYLDEYLDDDQYAQVDAFFQQHVGAGLQFLGALKPFALQATAMAVTASCDEVVSYEGYFLEQAMTGDYTVTAVESAEFQATLFDDIPMQQQVNWLWEIVDDVEAGQALFQELTSVYLSEDMDALFEVIVSEPEFQEYQGLILDDRNLAWVEPIRAQIHQQPTFIAVGSGHIAGELGMLELLRAEGYTVEPIARAD